MKLSSMAGVVWCVAAGLMGGDVSASGYHSSAAFRPMQPSDATDIYQNGNYLYNQSTTDTATVVANLGYINWQSGPVNAQVYGYTQGNGATTNCTLNAQLLNGTPARYASPTVTVGPATAAAWPGEGYFLLPLSIAAGQLPVPGVYTLQAICQLSPLQSGGPAEQLWGYWTPSNS